MTFLSSPVHNIGGIDTGDIANSLRFRSAASAYLESITGTPSSAYKRAFVFWLKEGASTTSGTLYSCSSSGSTGVARFQIRWDGSSLEVAQYNGSTYDIRVATTRVFRDPIGHRMVRVVIDTTQATAANRVQIQVGNDAVETSFTSATYPSLNSSPYCCTSGKLQRIGLSTNGAEGLDGYLSRYCSIDGWTAAPANTDFGYLNTTINEWVSKTKSQIRAAVLAGGGARNGWGANGCMENFENATSLTTLGYDTSQADDGTGGNHWTSSGHSLTAGVTYDHMLDVSGNSYATLNPLLGRSTKDTLADGNLKTTFGATGATFASMAVSSGKWYWETTITSKVGGVWVGINVATASDLVSSGRHDYGTNAQKYDGATTSYGATYTTGDVIGVALDMDAGTLIFYKNGASQGTAFSSGIAGTAAFPWFYDDPGGVQTVNFGQRPFAYTPPTSFLPLCQANLPAKDITEFPVDLAIIKNRDGATGWRWADRLRGPNLTLESNSTAAEYSTTDFNTVMKFTRGGLEVGASLNVNTSGQKFVAYVFKGGLPLSIAALDPVYGSPTIASECIVNKRAGYSIVTYTGTGANATVGHGLGVAPKMVIVKSRTSAVYDWITWHTAFGATDGIFLNGTGAKFTDATLYRAAPNSSVLTFGTYGGVNGATTMVAYCFAEIPGYSKIGSYTGNGSADGPYVHCGFRPRFVMIKRSDSTGEWIIIDTTRATYNSMGLYLSAQASNAELGSGASLIDAVSSGFKLRTTSTDMNAGTIIFIAFAEFPGNDFYNLTTAR